MELPNKLPDYHTNPDGSEGICRLKEVSEQARRLLQGGECHRFIEESPCNYIGALTDLMCGTVAGIHDGEIVASSKKIIPCLRRGETVALQEGFVPGELILQPSQPEST